jgi:uncharacterized surface protein with fasciclin (FAS1) repeats
MYKKQLSMRFRKVRIPGYAVIILILSVIISGCQKDILDQEKYQPGSWLKGKIFTQLQTQEDLSVFIECLQRTGYDTILNTSGSYSVFSPTDSAFGVFFRDHPEYNSLSDISDEDLEALVQYQVINDAWSIQQFKSLDIYGWIDPTDELSKPRAFKHQTILRADNIPYPAKRSGNKYRIVKPQEAVTTLKAFTQSNKFCPVFFEEYFDVYRLSFSDYEFYFNRVFESGNLYYSNARFNQEIPAENGFIYKTDRVILPLPNGGEILKEGYGDYTYQEFLSLIHQFSEFSINMDATYEQPGAKEGLDVDTLYNLSFPDLVFSIHNELTGNVSNPLFTYRDQHGLLAPTDEAFEEFIGDYISPGWGSFEAMPIEIKKIIVNAYMSRGPVYSSDISKGFINGNQDSVIISPERIIQKSFGSNCTFLGLDAPVIPRAFISICRPLYLTRQYTTMLYAVEATKVLSALKRPNEDYAFYLPSDLGIGMAGDSSLTRIVDDPDLNRYHFEEYDKGFQAWKKMSLNDLQKKILNQIAVRQPNGIANKEFIRNLGGNYIIVNNEQGYVSGSSTTTFGVGGEQIDLQPVLYGKETDNGEVYTVSSFFNFSLGVSYYSLFISRYLEFYNLLRQAGLFDPSYYTFPFLTDGEYYTVFIPSSQALADYRVDTLSQGELREFLKYHFVREHLIFTDGNNPDGNYPTTRVDESSTTYKTRYSELNMRMKPDVIEILDKDGNVYTEIHENGNRTNQMITFDPNKQSDSKWDYITTGIVHEIDKVLVKDLLQKE